MRATLTLGLLAFSVGLICVDEAPAFGRRNRRSACATPCYSHRVPPKDSCSCDPNPDGTDVRNTCEVNCLGACYSIKYNNWCYCGCHEEKVPTYSFFRKDRIALKANNITRGKLNDLLNLVKDHRVDPKWLKDDQYLLIVQFGGENSFKVEGTVSDQDDDTNILKQLKIDVLPP